MFGLELKHDALDASLSHFRGKVDRNEIESP